MEIASNYYRIAKPGIIYGNMLHALAFALFAWSLTPGSVWSVIWMIVGVSFVIGSACVVNCITDLPLDSKMDRTKKRPLPMHKISIRNAAVYAAVLFALGSVVLLAYTNVVVWIWAVIGHVTYTVVYGYVKRHSWTGTMVGTVPGVSPAMAGYAAVNPHMPLSAWLLGLAVLIWQLPHFYALSLYKKDDYAKSGLPMMSVVKSRTFVVWNIIIMATLYACAAVLLVVLSPLPKLATGLFAVAAVIWVGSVVFAGQRGTDAWARKTFGTSLYMPIVIFIASVVAIAAA